MVHDLPESIVGDIDAMEIANGDSSKKEKEKNEMEAMLKIKKTLPSKTGEEIFNLWKEYEDGETREAKFVKALDKIETTTQLLEIGYTKWDYPEFIVSYPNKAVKDFPELMGMLKILKRKLKKEFEKGGLEWKEEYESLE